MKFIPAALLLLVISASSSFADLVAFGSGADSFSMEFVSVGSLGNVADTTALPNPSGKVDYAYNIGKYEVSRGMVTKASNAGGLNLTLGDLTSFGGNGVNRPATGVTWNEAARFVNWLNVSQGFSPAYKFTTQPGGVGYDSNENISLWQTGDAGFNAANPFRSTQAQYFLPSTDEWYKAAYFDPSANAYYDYATGSDSPPTAVASGTAAGTAVFFSLTWPQAPADIDQAGGLSPFGTMGQGGNAREFQETEYDFVNDDPSANRGVRGGSFATNSPALSSSNWSPRLPNEDHVTFGFRVAALPAVTAVPEAHSFVMWGLLLACAGIVRACSQAKQTWRCRNRPQSAA